MGINHKIAKSRKEVDGWGHEIARCYDKDGNKGKNPLFFNRLNKSEKSE